MLFRASTSPQFRKNDIHNRIRLTNRTYYFAAEFVEVGG